MSVVTNIRCECHCPSLSSRCRMAIITGSSSTHMPLTLSIDYICSKVPHLLPLFALELSALSGLGHIALPHAPWAHRKFSWHLPAASACFPAVQKTASSFISLLTTTTSIRVGLKGPLDKVVVTSTSESYSANTASLEPYDGNSPWRTPDSRHLHQNINTYIFNMQPSPIFIFKTLSCHH